MSSVRHYEYGVFWVNQILVVVVAVVVVVVVVVSGKHCICHQHTIICQVLILVYFVA